MNVEDLKIPSQEQLDEQAKALYRLNDKDIFIAEQQKAKHQILTLIKNYKDIEKHNRDMELMFHKNKLDELSGMDDWKAYRYGLKNLISKLQKSLSFIETETFEEWKKDVEKAFPDLKKAVNS